MRLRQPELVQKRRLTKFLFAPMDPCTNPALRMHNWPVCIHPLRLLQPLTKWAGPPLMHGHALHKC